jgi:glucose/mannose transport system substrate-binding protein
MDAINIFVTEQNVNQTFKEILWIAEDNGYLTD